MKAIQILERYGQLLLDQTMDITYEQLNEAIKELKDIEHYSHYTTGLWATDRPDLFKSQIDQELMYPLNFWNVKLENNKIEKANVFHPYVDETTNPSEAYLTLCINHSPWEEHDENMVRVLNNKEAHKMLKLLEKHFGIEDKYKEQ